MPTTGHHGQLQSILGFCVYHPGAYFNNIKATFRSTTPTPVLRLPGIDYKLIVHLANLPTSSSAIVIDAIRRVLPARAYGRNATGRGTAIQALRTVANTNSMNTTWAEKAATSKP